MLFKKYNQMSDSDRQPPGLYPKYHVSYTTIHWIGKSESAGFLAWCSTIELIWRKEKTCRRKESNFHKINVMAI